MRTTIYVDGFNLYYGCLKDTSYKWVNLQVLFSNILASHYKITRIKYFTAHINPTSKQSYAPARQKSYLKALETIPELSMHFGHFVRHKKPMPRTKPPHETVEVFKTEEKGSDVNFSVHLLNDAWKDNFDCAVLVTNDSDMKEAMRLVRVEFPNKKLGLITPSSNPTPPLKKYARFWKPITENDLATAQFGNPVHRPGKTPIYKPKSW